MALETKAITTIFVADLRHSADTTIAHEHAQTEQVECNKKNLKSTYIVMPSTRKYPQLPPTANTNKRHLLEPLKTSLTWHLQKINYKYLRNTVLATKYSYARLPRILGVIYMLVKVLLRNLIQHISAFFLNSLDFRRIGQCNRTAGYRCECKFRPPHNRTMQNNKTFKGRKGGRNVTNEL